MRFFALAVIGVLTLYGCPDPLENDDDDDDSTEEDVEMTCEPHENCVGDHCEQVLIDTDTFVMGSTDGPRVGTTWPSGDDRPPHEVTVDAFCIDKYEVSLERYERCVDEGECTRNGLEWDDEEREVQTVVNHYPDHCWPDRKACLDYAVNGKNYRQAFDYCAYNGARLCTEAEWERAANGPGDQNRPNPWGDAPFTAELINVPSVGSGYVDPVDSHPTGQSVEGVYNMGGNVYEWVADAYTEYSDGPEDNPLFPPETAQTQVVGRGSCFFTEPVNTVTERYIFNMQFDWG